MVKDHSDSEKGNLKLPHHVLLFPISIIIPQTGLHIPQPLDTSCGALAGMRNSLMCLPRGIDPTTNHIMNECSTTEPYENITICSTNTNSSSSNTTESTNLIIKYKKIHFTV